MEKRKRVYPLLFFNVECQGAGFMSVLTVECQREQSKRVYSELCDVIPGGVNSPVRSFPGLEQTPLIAASGQGDRIQDVDDRLYIDFCSSWGSLIHGHAHPKIVEEVKDALDLGSSFGITTEIEGRLAKRVVNTFSSIEKLRFVSSGTEATMSAIRLARGVTGKDLLVKFIGNYHGHADHLLVQAGSGLAGLSETSSSKGVPASFVQQTLSLPYNQIDACRQVFQNPDFRDKIAAVIVEPIAGNMGVVPADQKFLQYLRQETSQMGALLIFDEVITGFRVSSSGAQGLYGIDPDLTCLGKIVGGGFPAAAFGGKAVFMDRLAPLGPIYQAGTLSGNPIAMQAGLTTLQLLEKEGTYENLEEKTDVVTKPVQEALEKAGLNACVQQVGSMFTIFWGRKCVESMEDTKDLKQEDFVTFFRFLFNRGIYVPPSQMEACFVSTVHTQEHLEYTRDVILEYISKKART